MRRKALRLRAQTEGSSIVDKLRQELREYKDILKCSICHERPKEVSVYNVLMLWADKPELHTWTSTVWCF